MFDAQCLGMQLQSDKHMTVTIAEVDATLN